MGPLNYKATTLKPAGSSLGTTGKHKMELLSKNTLSSLLLRTVAPQGSKDKNSTVSLKRQSNSGAPSPQMDKIPSDLTNDNLGPLPIKQGPLPSIAAPTKKALPVVRTYVFKGRTYPIVEFTVTASNKIVTPVTRHSSTPGRKTNTLLKRTTSKPRQTSTLAMNTSSVTPSGTVKNTDSLNTFSTTWRPANDQPYNNNDKQAIEIPVHSNIDKSLQNTRSTDSNPVTSYPPRGAAKSTLRPNMEHLSAENVTIKTSTENSSVKSTVRSNQSNLNGKAPIPATLTPSHTLSQTSSHSSSNTLSQTTSHTPSQTPSHTTNHTPSQTPNQTPSHTTNHTPSHTFNQQTPRTTTTTTTSKLSKVPASSNEATQLQWDIKSVTPNNSRSNGTPATLTAQVSSTTQHISIQGVVTDTTNLKMATDQRTTTNRVISNDDNNSDNHNSKNGNHQEDDRNNFRGNGDIISSTPGISVVSNSSNLDKLNTPSLTTQLKNDGNNNDFMAGNRDKHSNLSSKTDLSGLLPRNNVTTGTMTTTTEMDKKGLLINEVASTSTTTTSTLQQQLNSTESVYDPTTRVLYTRETNSDSITEDQPQLDNPPQQENPLQKIITSLSSSSSTVPSQAPVNNDEKNQDKESEFLTKTPTTLAGIINNSYDKAGNDTRGGLNEKEPSKQGQRQLVNSNSTDIPLVARVETKGGNENTNEATNPQITTQSADNKHKQQEFSLKTQTFTTETMTESALNERVINSKGDDQLHGLEKQNEQRNEGDSEGNKTPFSGSSTPSSPVLSDKMVEKHFKDNNYNSTNNSEVLVDNDKMVTRNDSQILVNSNNKFVNGNKNVVKDIINSNKFQGNSSVIIVSEDKSLSNSTLDFRTKTTDIKNSMDTVTIPLPSPAMDKNVGDTDRNQSNLYTVKGGLQEDRNLNGKITEENGDSPTIPIKSSVSQKIEPTPLTSLSSDHSKHGNETELDKSSGPRGHLNDKTSTTTLNPPTHFIYRTYKRIISQSTTAASNVTTLNTGISTLHTSTAPKWDQQINWGRTKNPNRQNTRRRNNYTGKSKQQQQGGKTTVRNDSEFKSTTEFLQGGALLDNNVIKPFTATVPSLGSMATTDLGLVGNTTMTNGVDTGPAIGIILACIVAFWIILGPLICIACRLKDKAKQRRSRSQEDEMGTRLVEEMVRMELARGRDKKYETSVSDMREIEPLKILAENDYENLQNLCNDKSAMVGDECFIGFANKPPFDGDLYDTLDEKKHGLPYIIDGNSIYVQYSEDDLPLNFPPEGLRYIDASTPASLADKYRQKFNFSGTPTSIRDKFNFAGTPNSIKDMSRRVFHFAGSPTSIKDMSKRVFNFAGSPVSIKDKVFNFAGSPTSIKDMAKQAFNFSGYKSNGSISADSGIEKTANSILHDLSNLSMGDDIDEDDDRDSLDDNHTSTAPNDTSSNERSLDSSPALSGISSSRLRRINDNESAGSLTNDSDSSCDNNLDINTDNINHRRNIRMKKTPPTLKNTRLKKTPPPLKLLNSKTLPQKLAPVKCIDPNKYLICNNHIGSLEKGTLYTELNECRCEFRQINDNNLTDDCAECGNRRSVAGSSLSNTPGSTPGNTPNKQRVKRTNGRNEYERLYQDTTV